jgi:uncharacterized membrane protein
MPLRRTETSPRRCQVCGSTEGTELRLAAVVRPALVQLIVAELGAWDESGWICGDDLQRFRHRYVEGLLRAEKGELNVLETEVVESLREHEILASNPDAEFEADLTFGQRLADKVALFGGSWAFISLFGAVMLVWIFANTYLLATRPFDPYPFILLNLVLSCLAAIQAPIIMMSQNRQQARDRGRADHDYQINLKAELEIRHLHQKVDHLLSHQWERLIEIQEIQMELMNELRSRR